VDVLLRALGPRRQHEPTALGMRLLDCRRAALLTLPLRWLHCGCTTVAADRCRYCNFAALAFASTAAATVVVSTTTVVVSTTTVVVSTAAVSNHVHSVRSRYGNRWLLQLSFDQWDNVLHPNRLPFWLPRLQAGWL